MLPSQFPEVQNYPHLRQLLQLHVDMQFGEIQKMLGQNGFNFPLASYLLDMISGISVAFFQAEVADIIDSKGRGRRFRELIQRHYPDEKDLAVPRQELVGVLYYTVRNPLSHCLGLDLPNAKFPNRLLEIAKRGQNPSYFTASEINELEDSVTRPSFAPPTITSRAAKDHTTYLLTLSSLYWGTHRMLHYLFSNSVEAKAAETLANEFLIHM
ncbi:hypothetical protein MUP59_07775 [Candidatus Bathyarchaeota archaeon]|nr:hypothetical protein [Candidatus Bathyarchaeota archaeon]